MSLPDRDIDALAHLLATGCDLWTAAGALGMAKDPVSLSIYASYRDLPDRILHIMTKGQKHGLGSRLRFRPAP